MTAHRTLAKWMKITIGIFFTSFVVVMAFALFSTVGRRPGLSLEDALWVSDWEISTIYGPVTHEQQTIVRQLRSAGYKAAEFATPVLYRMGGNSGMNSNEGVLLIPFDPERPQDALALKADHTFK